MDDSDALLDLLRRTDDLGVVSTYLNADPYGDPGPEGRAIDIRNRFRELHKRLLDQGSQERARALATHLENLAASLQEINAPGQPGRGRILFTALSSGWSLSLASQLPVANRVVLDDGPFVHPLLELLDEGRRAGVLVHSADTARLYEWRLGRLQLLSTLEREVIEAPHERSGPIGGGPAGRSGTPVREQRQTRERDRAARFLDEVTAAAARLGEERRWERVLVSGGPRWTEPVAEALAKLPVSGRSFEGQVVQDTRVLSGLGDGELATTVTDVLRDAHDAAETSLLERLTEQEFRAAALGLSEVSAALNTGRVAHLVYDPEVRYTGYVAGDGRLFGGDEVPALETGAVHDTRFTERMVERALETGARISPVEAAATGALQQAQGTAALLRW